MVSRNSVNWDIVTDKMFRHMHRIA
jgi:hypothetical protein